jgi:hypothetical protein
MIDNDGRGNLFLVESAMKGGNERVVMLLGKTSGQETLLEHFSEVRLKVWREAKGRGSLPVGNMKPQSLPSTVPFKKRTNSG